MTWRQSWIDFDSRCFPSGFVVVGCWLDGVALVAALAVFSGGHCEIRDRMPVEWVIIVRELVGHYLDDLQKRKLVNINRRRCANFEAGLRRNW